MQLMNNGIGEIAMNRLNKAALKRAYVGFGDQRLNDKPDCEESNDDNPYNSSDENNNPAQIRTVKRRKPKKSFS